MLQSKARPIARSLTYSVLAGFVAMASLISSAQPSPGAKPSGGSAAEGKKVYEANRCASCHIIAGKGGKSGPDLSHEGAKRSASWVEAEIKNPKSHKPDAKMPAYAEKIKGKDLADLVAYLESLKK